MYKLSGLDAGFLYNETELCPQQVGTVQLMELPEGVDVDGFIVDVDGFIVALKQMLMERIHLVAYLTNRLVETPFLFDHPVWTTDTDFHIDNHVERREVPQPGRREQWEGVVAELHEQPFDRSKPLWRLVVLTGLEEGHIACYQAMHHACIDGLSGQIATELLMDRKPQPRVVERPPNDLFRPRPVSALDLTSLAVENLLKAWARQAAGVLDAFDSAVRVQRRAWAWEPGAGFGALADAAPDTRFNQSIGAERTYASGEVGLTPAKKIAMVTGCTLNDLFLALCGGGIRRYLERRGELPEASMIAGCPVSLRQPGDHSMSTQVTLMQVTLGTEHADPIRRLTAIAASSRTAKSVTADLAGFVDANPVGPWLPLLQQAFAKLGEGARVADSMPVPFNVLVSNVPGPRHELYSAGARMLTHYPVSIPAHGLGVNITLQSYNGTMFFAITACARTLPDAAVLRDDMLAEFAALQSILRAPTPEPRRTTVPAAVGNEPARAA
jgi:WS/DGAT/MGAT family acyltransferase